MMTIHGWFVSTYLKELLLYGHKKHEKYKKQKVFVSVTDPGEGAVKINQIYDDHHANTYRFHVLEALLFRVLDPLLHVFIVFTISNRSLTFFLKTESLWLIRKTSVNRSGIRMTCLWDVSDLITCIFICRYAMDDSWMVQQRYQRKWHGHVY